MNNERKFKIIALLTPMVIAAIAALIITTKGNVHLRRGETYVMQSATDSLMIDGRHMGNVNLNKFVALAEQLSESAFLSYEIDGDSAIFRIGKKRYFYGMDDGESWITSYRNLPISITDEGFIAKVNTIDSVDYVYIPYQILSCVAHNAAARVSPQEVKHSVAIRDTLSTIRNMNVLPKENASSGKKIQVEGYVLKNVTDILSKNSRKSLSRYEQMEVLWRYAKDNWNYINDPETESDTWRSASETIENYYFVDGRCYSGDCDDFAILMASFARQIGYESHMVAAFKGNSGHAYAEFRDPDIPNSKWVSLDWNSDRFGGKPYDGKVVRIYTDL